jgi:hypothetical protein
VFRVNGSIRKGKGIIWSCMVKFKLGKTGLGQMEGASMTSVISSISVIKDWKFRGAKAGTKGRGGLSGG